MHRPVTAFRTAVFTGIFVSASLLPSMAVAQPIKNEKAAEARNDQGKHAFDRSDFETARQAFSDAYELSPKPKYLKNIAAAELNLNRPLEALKHFKQFVKDPGTSRQFVDQVKPLMDQASARTGHISVDAPAGTKLSIDGTDTGEQTPLKDPIDVNPGRTTVQGLYNGKTANVTVQADPGKTTPVHLTFESQDATVPPVATSGPREASGAPSASAGNEPVSPSEMPHESGGFKSPPVATYILGGVALAALGTGIGFSLDSRSKKDDSSANANACGNPSSPECAHYRDIDDSGKRSATIGWIAYAGAGAALVAGGLVWALAPNTKTTPARSTVVPLAGPGVAGIRLQTSF